MVANIYDSISKKSLSSEIDLTIVNEWIDKYPVFHSAYLMKGFLLNTQSSNGFQNASSQIAVNVLDRAKLYDIIQEDTPWRIEEREIVEEPLPVVLNDSIGLEWIADSPEQIPFDEEVKEILDNARSLNEEETVIEPKAQISIGDNVDWINEELVEETIKSENDAIDKNILAKDEEKENTVDSSPLSYIAWLQQKKKNRQNSVPDSDNKKQEISFEMPSQVEAELMLEGHRTKDKLEDFISTQIQKKRSHKQTQEIALVSETLAEILLLQNKHDEAIKTYQTLSLKYPQKSTYFARQIEEIKKQL